MFRTNLFSLENLSLDQTEESNGYAYNPYPILQRLLSGNSDSDFTGTFDALSGLGK